MVGFPVLVSLLSSSTEFTISNPSREGKGLTALVGIPNPVSCSWLFFFLFFFSVITRPSIHIYLSHLGRQHSNIEQASPELKEAQPDPRRNRPSKQSSCSIYKNYRPLASQLVSPPSSSPSHHLATASRHVIDNAGQRRTASNMLFAYPVYHFFSRDNRGRFMESPWKKGVSRDRRTRSMLPPGMCATASRGCQCQQRGQEEDGTVDACRWAIAVVPQQPWVSRMSDVGSAVTR